MASRKRARAEDIPSSSNPPPPTATMEPNGLQAQPIHLAHNRPIVFMEQFLDKVAWPEAQLLLGRSPKVSPRVEILPLPPAPPAPPLILILDDSDNKVATPPNSPAYYLEDGYIGNFGKVLFFTLALSQVADLARIR
ncbi:hypothetical protein GmHk_04G010492 [Glycine max]|nr:hypothetical protein GmHk_04G010492 [Glycine max]